MGKGKINQEIFLIADQIWTWWQIFLDLFSGLKNTMKEKQFKMKKKQKYVNRFV